jgi:hypothetical protein
MRLPVTLCRSGVIGFTDAVRIRDAMLGWGANQKRTVLNERGVCCFGDCWRFGNNSLQGDRKQVSERTVRNDEIQALPLVPEPR